MTSFTMSWRSPLVAAALCVGALTSGEARSRDARNATDARTSKAVAHVRVQRVVGHTAGEIYAVRGYRGGARLVFLHGMCDNPLDDLERFKGAVSQRGILVSPRGEAPCPNGRGSTYSTKLEELDERILQGFAALRVPDPKNVVVIGYSLGAVVAQELARKYPERYTRLILIGAPATPEPMGLTHLQSAAMIVGERERQDLMRRGAAKLRAAKIPTTFMLLPEARHGELGPDAERVMAEALDWTGRQRELLKARSRAQSPALPNPRVQVSRR